MPRGVTPAGVRAGDPGALAGLVELRGDAVLAYAAAVTGPGPARDAAAEAFARFRAHVAALEDVRGLQPDDLLRGAVRETAAARVPPPTRGGVRRLARGRETCAWVPRLVAARANRVLSSADTVRLDRHLAGCVDCRAVRERFRTAEQAYGEAGTVPLSEAEARALLFALATAAPLASGTPQEVANAALALLPDEAVQRPPAGTRPAVSTAEPEPEPQPAPAPEVPALAEPEVPGLAPQPESPPEAEAPALALQPEPEVPALAPEPQPEVPALEPEPAAQVPALEPEREPQAEPEVPAPPLGLGPDPQAEVPAPPPEPAPAPQAEESAPLPEPVPALEAEVSAPPPESAPAPQAEESAPLPEHGSEPLPDPELPASAPEPQAEVSPPPPELAPEPLLDPEPQPALPASEPEPRAEVSAPPPEPAASTSEPEPESEPLPPAAESIDETPAQPAPRLLPGSNTAESPVVVRRVPAHENGEPPRARRLTTVVLPVAIVAGAVVGALAVSGVIVPREPATPEESFSLETPAPTTEVGAVNTIQAPPAPGSAAARRQGEEREVPEAATQQPASTPEEPSTVSPGQQAPSERAPSPVPSAPQPPAPPDPPAASAASATPAP